MLATESVTSSGSPMLLFVEYGGKESLFLPQIYVRKFVMKTGNFALIIKACKNILTLSLLINDKNPEMCDATAVAICTKARFNKKAYNIIYQIH